MSRFAPLTSELFVRKGDATPSAVAATGAKPSLFWQRAPAPMPPPPPSPVLPVAAAPPPKAETPPPPPPSGDKPHRMMVTLSQAEFERIGIAAVKKGLTRQQVLRAALDAHLDRIKREYGGCGCMAMGGGACEEGCGAQ
ncbi:MAG TPA: hypothetical protein VG387_02130 [Rhizomicrobium sp.]|jgi:hypothetical protein|nr:hypothetical protein [Rhizomicrobium sp.]